MLAACALTFFGWRVGASRGAAPVGQPRFVPAAALPAPLPPPSGRTDITGQTGSGAFGTQVVVLPNGNFVVTDPTYDEGGVTDIGAVYLYDGATLALISTLKGVTTAYSVGNGAIVVLTGGNHFVVSTLWDIPGGAEAGYKLYRAR